MNQVNVLGLVGVGVFVVGLIIALIWYARKEAKSDLLRKIDDEAKKQQDKANQQYQQRQRAREKAKLETPPSNSISPDDASFVLSGGHKGGQDPTP